MSDFCPKHGTDMGSICVECADDAYREDVAELKQRIAELEADQDRLKDIVRDMYVNDDGRAWTEAAKYFDMKGWSLKLGGQR